MSRAIILLSMVVIAGYVTPDLLRAHSHLPALPESGGQSLKSPGTGAFIGPVLRTEGLSQHAQQSSWDQFSLTHTDASYLPSSERHHPAGYRIFNAPDGVALMFSWPFGNVPALWMSPQGTPDEPPLKEDHLR